MKSPKSLITKNKNTNASGKELWTWKILLKLFVVVPERIRFIKWKES